jgi:hypothetical protein
MQPFNYRQQVVNPFEQAVQGAAQGFQLGANVRAFQQQQQALEQERLLAEEARARQQQLQMKLGNLMQKENPTFRDYEEIAVLLPKDAAEGLRKNYELMSKEKQDSSKKFSGQVVSALSSSNPDLRQRGIELLKQRAEAERNAGNNEEAQGYELHARIAETGPDGAKSVVNEVMTFGSTVFGKDWAEGVLKIQAEPEAGFRPVTRADRARFAAEGNPLPEGIPFQIGPKGEIKEVTRGPMVTVQTGKDDDTLFKEIIVKRIGEFSSSAASARTVAQTSRVVSNLLKGAGGGQLIKLTTDLKRDLGFESDTVTANDLANSLGIRGATQIRAPGSGSTSDLEFKAYVQAFPTLANSEPGRMIMAKYAEAFAKRSAKLADHAMRLGRNYSEEEMARFDESLGPLLGEDFYELIRGRRPGVPQYQAPAQAPSPAPAPAPAAPAQAPRVRGSIRQQADEILRGGR